MVDYDFLVNIISAMIAIMVMLIVLYVQRKLEREVNGYRQLLILHFFNVLVMMMFYGATTLALKVVQQTLTNQVGHVEFVFFDIIGLPFPLILVTYAVCAYIIRQRVRPPYIVEEDTNIVYLKNGINNRR